MRILEDHPIPYFQPHMGPKIPAPRCWAANSCGTCGSAGCGSPPAPWSPWRPIRPRRVAPVDRSEWCPAVSGRSGSHRWLRSGFGDLYSYGSYGMEAHYFTCAKDIHQLRGDLTLEASCSSLEKLGCQLWTQLIGVSWNGDSQVTMGFNTQSWSSMTWMIWGTPMT